MSRHEIRVLVFKLIFRYSFHKGTTEMQEQIDGYNEELLSDYPDVTDAVTSEVKAKAQAICDKIPELDAQIEAVTEGWKKERMNTVDLSILRLALYEMRYDDGVPVRVAINEAVELAKEFGGEASPRFVNGVLAKMDEAK